MARDSDATQTKTKAQIRWQWNKEAQRRRAKREPAELSAEFLESVELERAKRASLGARKWAWNHPDLNFFTPNGRQHWVKMHGGHWHAFAADVWAATAEIEASLGDGKATATRIARHLEAKNRLHGYAVNSARTMVPRARLTVSALEQAALNDPEAVAWRPFATSAQNTFGCQ